MDGNSSKLFILCLLNVSCNLNARVDFRRCQYTVFIDLVILYITKSLIIFIFDSISPLIILILCKEIKWCKYSLVSILTFLFLAEVILGY